MRGNSRAVSLLSIFTILLISTGCGAMKHRDTMIFGTDTTFGVNISQDLEGKPDLTVGYNRSEGVIMPLFINAADSDLISKNKYKTGGLKGSLIGGVTSVRLDPKVNQILDNEGVSIDDAKYYSGINEYDTTGEIVLKEQFDAYSVFASFSGKVKGAGSVQIGQVFSTGVAAQELAKEYSRVVAAYTGGEVEAEEGEKPARDFSTVWARQQALKDLDYLKPNSDGSNPVDGDWGSGSKSAHRAFQKQAGLPETDEWNSETEKSINKALDDKKS